MTDFDFYSLPLMERWDVVLKWFVISQSSWPNGSIADIVNHINFLSHHKYIGWEGNLLYNLKSIVEKLEKDCYINYEGQRQLSEDSPPFDVYAATEKGREFYLIQGGYIKHFENKNQAKNHAEQVEKAMLVNNNWMKIGTLVAAGATSSLVLIEFLKAFVTVQIDLKSSLILLFFGICIGATILPIIQELVNRKSK